VDIQQLQLWAAKELAISSSNRAIPFSTLPEFVRQIPAPILPWKAYVEPERSVVRLISAGSFGGFGISVGSQTNAEPTNNLCHQIAPGVYIHRYP
jgi:hypothetical protein